MFQTSQYHPDALQMKLLGGGSVAVQERNGHQGWVGRDALRARHLFVLSTWRKIFNSGLYVNSCWGFLVVC